MPFRSSNTIEGCQPSDDAENSHLSPAQAKELNKRARQIDKALIEAAQSGVLVGLTHYVEGEVERITLLQQLPESVEPVQD